MSRPSDFGYLSPESIYLDAACQSMRPTPVINAMNEYYTQYNSCGERVKHAWGAQVDKRVAATRARVLDYLHLKERDYVVSFTLNTTYGLNLLLSQLDPTRVRTVVTSDIEHNSVFLSTMSFARRHNIERVVLARLEDGSLPLEYDFTRALVVVNAVSNIDGRELRNINELIRTVHSAGGLVIIDAAQAFAHARHLLEKTEADALCFSAHKAYAPSLGGIVFRRSLIDALEPSFVGGGMVEHVTEHDFTLARHEPHTLFEAGLQSYGEIIAFSAALAWLMEKDAADRLTRMHAYGDMLHDTLAQLPRVTLVNTTPNTTLAFHHDTLDAHLIAEVLSDEGIMARSGYFCCHYYLKEQQKLPPLVRLSLGLHTSEQDITTTQAVLERILV